MVGQTGLVTRYAGALVDVAMNPRAGVQPPKVAADLRSFVETFEGSEELRNALQSPAIPLARKRAVLARIAELLGMSRTARNFLFVLSDHRRMDMVPATLEAFERLLDERLGYVRAQVRSARELDQAQRDSLAGQLEKLTGKKVRMAFAVDAGLVGGVVARIGSTVYDGSVRGQLAALGKILTGS
jgi:F-type H+-transporting ATPase subunit delta